MRTDYKDRILKIFVESYPGSAQFRGGRKLRRGDWEHIFPDINDSPDNKDAFISAVEELEEEGIVSVKWIRFRKGDRVDALYLENPDKIYQYLGEDTPENIRESVLSFIHSYKTDSRATIKIIEYIKKNYISGDKELFNNYEDIRDILKLLDVSPEEAGKYNIRALSVKLFNNSKRVERIKDKADRLSMLCGEQTLTERLGIERSFPETSISGNAVIEFANGDRWSLNDNILTLPLSTARNIKNIIMPVKNPKILSIENKETFHVLSKAPGYFGLYVYCAGRINNADKSIFEILNGNNYEFYHSGDLDPDGLKIFDEIDVLLGGKLNPYMMDIDTYSKYFEFGYQLSHGALKGFDKFNNLKLKDLAFEILKTGKGVEQEILSYSS